MELAGRLVLLTGASRGLGRALALKLGSAGCRLALCARDASGLDQTIGEAQRAGAVEARPFLVDLRRTDSLRDLVARVERDVGPIELLVNNAGAATAGALATVPVASIEAIFTINALSPTILTREVLLSMLERRRGTIVFVSSGAGLRGLPNYAPYSAAKAAIGTLADALRAELRGTGIHVLTVYPGKLRTAFDASTEYYGLARHPVSGGRKPEVVAARIVRAVQQDRAVLTVGFAPTVAAILNRLAPNVVDAFVSARTRRSRRQASGDGP